MKTISYSPTASKESNQSQVSKTTPQEHEGLSKDFRELNLHIEIANSHHCFSVANLPWNINKNRYTDVKASEHTRVKLTCLPNELGSDYINANYIDDRSYISCQAPLPTTTSDFWRMTWETNSSLIIMLTRESERGCAKAFRYWPSAVNETSKWGCFEVQLLKESVYHGSMKRKLLLTKGSIKRHVCQLQYTHWPDHGTPSSTEEISKILDKKKKLSKQGSPTIVHCSAGIGRAGTFIAADLLLNKMTTLIAELQKVKLEEKPKEISKEEGNEKTSCLISTPQRLLKQIVWKLREQRCGMVQTEEQYKFIYQIFKDKLYSDWVKVYHLQSTIVESSRPFSDRFKVSYAILHPNEIEHFVGQEPVVLNSFSPINVKS
jgi:protein tyrosine phosphatase